MKKIGGRRKVFFVHCSRLPCSIFILLNTTVLLAQKSVNNRMMKSVLCFIQYHTKQKNDRAKNYIRCRTYLNVSKFHRTRIDIYFLKKKKKKKENEKESENKHKINKILPDRS